MGIFVACESSQDQRELDKTKKSKNQDQFPADDIVLGAEQLAEYLPMLSNKRVALVVNQTSVIGETHLVDTLTRLGVSIIKVFAPEHGFRGNHSAGAVVKNGIDQKSGLPVVSLYGKNKKPTASMLENIDIMVFDIQDVGVRFYTYISTMHYVMEACAELNKKVLVLDRPNPNGFYVDGPVLDPAYKSFIGMHKIPLVHGLTVAELALMINGEKWLKDGVICDLSVISCKNYAHDKLYQLPIRPSPNLPNMNSVYLYPYLGLFEGTNVSIGRGTDLPFQIVGRPQGEGDYSFTPRSIPGVSDHPKHEGKKCYGEVITDVQDSSIFINQTLNLSYLIKYYRSNPSENGEYFKDFIYKLAGNKEFRSQIESGLDEGEIRNSWEPKLGQYKEIRKKYLLYP